MLIDINNAYEGVVQLIMQTDGRWQWDDSNQPTTDQGDGTGGQPIATTSLVANQQDYALSVTHLIITRVELQDPNGIWNELRPFDEHDLLGASLTDFMKTAGTPTHYDKKGISVFLYPKPSYSQAASLKVYFQRPPVLYTSAEVTTGTKTPGFNTLYHELIPLKVAYEYHINEAEPTKAQLRLAQLTAIEERLKEDYSIRSDDDPPHIVAVIRSSR